MRFSVKRITVCALFAAVALGLSYLENLFPVTFIPIPGVKLGLANIVILFTLITLGIPEAFSVSVVRLLLGAIFAGNGSAFLFSLLGGLVSLSVMALLSRTKVSVYGISLAGAAAHQCGQIGAAMLLLKSFLPIGYLPALLLVSLVTGSLTGFITVLLYQAFAKARILPTTEK